jgi:amino acid transporter
MMVVMTAVAVAFVVVMARYIAAAHGAAALFDMRGLFRPESFSLRPLMLGASIATLSYIGFDAISTLAEDTLRPERDIAVATVLVCALQTVFCFATVYLAALAWPDFMTYPHQETAIMDIASRTGGPWMLAAMTFVLLVAGLASALTGQAGASRLLFGMGRDGVLPPRIFAHLDPKHSTPTRSIYLMAGVSAVGAVLMRFQLAVELLNFGALAGFICVNLSVICHFYVRCRRRRGTGFLFNLLFPALGAVVCTYVWMSLTLKARLAGFAWLALGVVYLAGITRGFRLKPKKMESLMEETAGGN